MKEMREIVMKKKCAVPMDCPTQVKCIDLVIKVREFRAVNNLQPSR